MVFVYGHEWRPLTNHAPECTLAELPLGCRPLGPSCPPRPSLRLPGQRRRRSSALLATETFYRAHGHGSVRNARLGLGLHYWLSWRCQWVASASLRPGAWWLPGTEGRAFQETLVYEPDLKAAPVPHSVASVSPDVAVPAASPAPVWAGVLAPVHPVVALAAIALPRPSTSPPARTPGPLPWRTKFRATHTCTCIPLRTYTARADRARPRAGGPYAAGAVLLKSSSAAARPWIRNIAGREAVPSCPRGSKERLGTSAAPQAGMRAAAWPSIAVTAMCLLLLQMLNHGLR